jgi:2-oxo-4-hydroxy-4-carboxy-5-ureidoimidazoline decarboxylase
MGTDGLTRFNDLPTGDARRALLECCSAPGWAEHVAAARPYGSVEDAIRTSDAIVTALTVADLAEALAGHPRIGEPPGPDVDGASAADWSRQEQSGVDADDRGTRRALAAANLEYERRFGHIYLVCATGRTGTELLALLRARLQNQAADEWQVVRAELQKINALRLRRILAGSP